MTTSVSDFVKVFAAELEPNMVNGRVQLGLLSKVVGTLLETLLQTPSAEPVKLLIRALQSQLDHLHLNHNTMAKIPNSSRKAFYFRFKSSSEYFQYNQHCIFGGTGSLIHLSLIAALSVADISVPSLNVEST